MPKSNSGFILVLFDVPADCQEKLSLFFAGRVVVFHGEPLFTGVSQGFSTL